MKNLTELFKDKAPDGKKFQDQHTVTVHKDLSPATSDKEWSGKPSTKTHDRASTRQGYSAGEDEKVYDGGDAVGMNQQKTGMQGSALPIVTMVNPVMGKMLTREEIELVENEYQNIEAQVITDLVEALELDESEIEIVLDAYIKHKSSLNEISKKTLGSYIVKAHSNAMELSHSARDLGDQLSHTTVRSLMYPDREAQKNMDHLDRKTNNRSDGIKRAATKLAASGKPKGAVTAGKNPSIMKFKTEATITELSANTLQSYIKKSVETRPSKDTPKTIKRRDLGWKAQDKLHDKEGK